MIDYVDNTNLLNQAIRPIAKHFGFDKEFALKLLRDTNGNRLDTIIKIKKTDSRVRQMVNNWWAANKKNFFSWGIGGLKKRKLAELGHVYDHLICLA